MHRVWGIRSNMKDSAFHAYEAALCSKHECLHGVSWGEGGISEIRFPRTVMMLVTLCIMPGFSMIQVSFMYCNCMFSSSKLQGCKLTSHMQLMTMAISTFAMTLSTALHIWTINWILKQKHIFFLGNPHRSGNRIFFWSYFQSLFYGFFEPLLLLSRRLMCILFHWLSLSRIDCSKLQNLLQFLSLYYQIKLNQKSMIWQTKKWTRNVTKNE